MDRSFEQQLAAARSGAEDAWRRIYAELAPVVRGYLGGRGAPEPEDLTGEVFTQVVRDLDRFDGDARGFRAWVMTIAHHRLLDDARGRARRPVQPVADPSQHTDGRRAPDAASEAEDRLALDRVAELLGELSDLGLALGVRELVREALEQDSPRLRELAPDIVVWLTAVVEGAEPR